jgi:hypothetical protein
VACSTLFQECIESTGLLPESPGAQMTDVATELLARFRKSEIDLSEFVREAEKLSLDEWQRLSAMILEWFGQQQTKPTSDH